MPLYGQNGYGSGRYGIADNGPIYKNPLGYYLALYTSQYKIAKNLLSWSNKSWLPIDNLTDCLAFLSGNYDLDVALGNQLDVIGLFLGQTRNLSFQPTNPTDSPVLNDDNYRLLLKAIRAKNHWDGKLTSLYNIWQTLFPGGRLIINDNQNMTATIIIAGNFSQLVIDMIEHDLIVPRPEGVLYTYVNAELPIFGTDLDNEFIAGVDKGHIS